MLTLARKSSGPRELIPVPEHRVDSLNYQLVIGPLNPKRRRDFPGKLVAPIPLNEAVGRDNAARRVDRRWCSIFIVRLAARYAVFFRDSLVTCR